MAVSIYTPPTVNEASTQVHSVSFQFFFFKAEQYSIYMCSKCSLYIHLLMGK